MPRAKKVVVKEPALDPVEIVVKEHEEVFKYNVRMEFNDQVHEFRTNDIARSIYDIKPTSLKTRVLVKVKSDEGECERMILLQLAKMMWRSKMGCDIFVSRLILK